MFYRAVIAATLATAWATAAAFPAAANLLSNPSFESGATLAPGGSESGNSGQYLPSWTYAAPVYSDRNRGPVSYPDYPAAASDGNYYIGLNWSPGLGVLINTITQPFTLASGSSGLTLTFDMSSEFGATDSTLTVSVLDSTGATTLLTSPAFNNTQGDRQWDAKSWSATLGAGSYMLAVTGATNGHADDVLLDNLNLTAALGATETPVPEPASLALLGSGLTLAAWARRRRG